MAIWYFQWSGNLLLQQQHCSSDSFQLHLCSGISSGSVFTSKSLRSSRLASISPSCRSPMYLNIPIRGEPNNTGWAIPSLIGLTFSVISCLASTSNSTAWLADLFSVASIQIPSCVFHIWRQNDIFPIDGLGTYIAGVGIHLHLCWLVSFPSIGTHRRLANLDSLVNHHTPSLFGLGSLAWAGHLVHIAHPLQMLSWSSALITSRWLELISPGFTLRNLFGLNWTALRSS